MKVISRKFYNKNSLDIARELLGCFIIRKIRNRIIRAMITEVEAYVGEDDLASHASRGRTPRTELMYGEPGYAYVYMIYGMYHCLNIVTEKKGFPAAVLIRAIAVDGVEYKKTNGPGKVCKILGIDRKLNGWDVTKGKKMWFEKSLSKAKVEITVDRRIGVDYAKHCKEYLWRFTLKEFAGKKKMRKGVLKGVN